MRDTDTGVLESTYRTVTPGYGSRDDTGMDLLGWVLFLGVFTLLFPLIPLALAIVGLGKLAAALGGRQEST
ncbi:DUF7535 family protein [Halohasta salina]|uniref:DUF7535 family protein n=1 Tax=Halohasta salina TaxID=2961621 RepID=UPI0020A4FA70|nr:hypothetical protein [Halohasta salina]